MNNYILRTTNFFYDDYYYFHPKYSYWKIHSKYDNLEAASKAQRALEIAAMKQQDLLDMFFMLHGNENFETTKRKLSIYFEKELHLSLKDQTGFFLKSLDDEKVLEIKKILNVEFYKLFEFKGDMVFYKPILNDEFWGQEFIDLDKGNIFEIDYKGCAFFNSKEDAIISIPKILNYWIDTYSQKLRLPGLSGKITDLSEKPIELKEFLENSGNFQYNTIENKIELKGNYITEDNLDLMRLIEFLVKKPYILLPISFEEASKIGYNTFDDAEIYYT